MELVAELRSGGSTRAVRVRCTAEAGGELRALRRGLGELQERVAELLAPLVLEQQRRGATGGDTGTGDGLEEGEEEEEEEDDNDEEDDEEENGVTAGQDDIPPTKRTRVQPP